MAPPGHLHRSLDASGLADCSVLLYCVSPPNSPRTSPCLGRSPLVCLACGWLCSCLACWLCSSACCWLCSSRFFFVISPLLDDLALLCERIVASMYFSLSSYPCCFTSFFLSPLTLWLWFCLGFSPLAPLQWLCLGFSPETLCGRLHLPGCLACTSNTTTQHCASRDRWLAAGARAPRSCSSQQRVLLTVRTGLRGRCRCGPSVVSNTTPTPLCDSLGCVHTHYEGLHRGLLPRRGPSVRPAPLACHRSSSLSRLVSFTGLVIVTRYFSSRVLMTFSLFLVVVTMSFALRSDAIARLIIDGFSLALHAGCSSHAFKLC